MNIIMAACWSVMEGTGLYCYHARILRKKEIELNKKAASLYGAACAVLAGVCGYFTDMRLGNYCDAAKLLAVFTALSMASIVDYKIKKIPNHLVLALLGARVVLFLPELVFYRDVARDSAIGSFFGGALVFIVLFFLSVASKSGIGMGDVKLLSAMGVMLGFYAVLNTLIFSLLGCVLAAMALVLSKKKNLKDKIPFGPFIFFGYIATLLMGAY